MLRFPDSSLIRGRATRPARLVRTVTSRVAALGSLGMVAAALVAGAPPARSAEEIGEIVKAFCRSAFASEMAQAGKPMAPGMADYACGCMADQIRGGVSLDGARSSCREATARRYRI